MNDISVYPYRVVGTQGGRGLRMKKHVEAFSCSIDLCVGVLSVREVKKLPLNVQEEECEREMHSFLQGPLPPSVYLGRQCKHQKLLQ